MPWSSANLPVLEASPELWPLRIASEVLGPPELSERQLRDRLRKAGIRPVGRMRTSGYDLGNSRGMRHVPLYDTNELIAFYETLPVR